MDKDNAVNKGKGASDKNQAEGWAFFKVIENWVKASDSAGARLLGTMYNTKTVNKKTDNYCKGLTVLLQILPVSYADLGTLNEDYSKYGVSYNCAGPDMQGLLADAAALKGAFGSCSSREMAAVKSVYTKGVHTSKQVMKTMGTLQKNVQTLNTRSAGVSDKALDEMILAAIAGTGSFKGAKSAGSAGCPARKEFVVKSIQNNLFSKMTINMANAGASVGTYLDLATAKRYGAKCAGCYNTRTHKITCGKCKTSLPNWTRGAWIYSGPAQSNMSPSATANKRAKNYDTKDNAFGSVVNKKIVAAFKAKPTTALAAVVNGQIHITYMQATLRYLNKMDKDNTKNKGKGAGFKNQGEGWGFFMVIADYVARADKALGELLMNAYDLDQTNTAVNNYCHGVSGLMKVLPKGTTAKDLGKLNESPCNCADKKANNRCSQVPVGNAKSAGSCYNQGGKHQVKCNVAQKVCKLDKKAYWYPPGFVGGSGCCHCGASCQHDKQKQTMQQCKGRHYDKSATGDKPGKNKTCPRSDMNGDKKVDIE